MKIHKITAFLLMAVIATQTMLLPVYANAEIKEIKEIPQEMASQDLLTDTGLERQPFLATDDAVVSEERAGGIKRTIKVMSYEDFQVQEAQRVEAVSKSGVSTMAATVSYSASPSSPSVYRDSSVTITTTAPYAYSYQINVIKMSGFTGDFYIDINDYNSGGRIYMTVRALHPISYQLQVLVDLNNDGI